MDSDGDGWQVIRPKGQKGWRKLATLVAKEAVVGASSAATPAETSVLDVAAIKADHEHICRHWRGSKAFKSLCAIISENAAAHTAIKTAVCLGLGSFDVRPNSSRRGRIQHDAHVQLEAFCEIVRILAEKHNGHSIKRYAQEPSFGPSDKEYCKTLGIEVVDTPQAFTYVASDAFVFGIHLPTPVWGYVLQERFPGLCIGTDLTSLERLLTTCHDNEAFGVVVERIRQMYASADKYVFPAAEFGAHLQHTFYGTDILWLQKGEDAAHEEIPCDDETGAG